MRRRGGQDSKNGVTCVGSTAAYEYGGIEGVLFARTGSVAFKSAAVARGVECGGVE